MWRLRWPRIELPSSNSRTTTADIRSSFSIRLNRERNASRLILSNTKNSTNNGTRIFFKLRKKMPRHLVS